MLKEFKEFAMRGSVVDMAVGIVIGAAFTSIVKSFVGGLVMPTFGLSLDGKEPAPFHAGAFLNEIITFLIVVFVLFLLVKGVNSLRRKQEEQPEHAPPPPRDTQLLEEIRDALVAKAPARKPAAKKTTTRKRAPARKSTARKAS